MLGAQRHCLVHMHDYARCDLGEHEVQELRTLARGPVQCTELHSAAECMHPASTAVPPEWRREPELLKGGIERAHRRLQEGPALGAHALCAPARTRSLHKVVRVEVELEGRPICRVEHVEAARPAHKEGAQRVRVAHSCAAQVWLRKMPHSVSARPPNAGCASIAAITSQGKMFA